MNIWMTGEGSQFCKAFEAWCKKHNKQHVVVNSLSNEYYDYFRVQTPPELYQKEIDVFDPTILTLLERSEVEVIVHAAAITNERVCEKYPELTIRTNIEGCFHAAKAAEKIDVPVINLLPVEAEAENTLYSISRSSGSKVMRKTYDEVVNLIFGYAFGEKFDNSPINQLLLSSRAKLDVAHIDMDPTFLKPFIYSEDLFTAFDEILNSLDKHIGLTTKISSEDHTVGDIIDYMNEIGLSPEYIFHDEMDEYGDIEMNFDSRNCIHSDKYGVYRGIEEFKEIIK
jgi:nucleoside-diphosphate-sugar epimerase